MRTLLVALALLGSLAAAGMTAPTAGAAASCSAQAIVPRWSGDAGTPGTLTSEIRGSCTSGTPTAYVCLQYQVQPAGQSFGGGGGPNPWVTVDCGGTSGVLANYDGAPQDCSNLPSGATQSGNGVLWRTYGQITSSDGGSSGYVYSNGPDGAGGIGCAEPVTIYCNGGLCQRSTFQAETFPFAVTDEGYAAAVCEAITSGAYWIPYLGGLNTEASIHVDPVFWACVTINETVAVEVTNQLYKYKSGFPTPVAGGFRGVSGGFLGLLPAYAYSCGITLTWSQWLLQTTIFMTPSVTDPDFDSEVTWHRTIQCNG